jgi:hypothetical protein
VGLSGIAKKVNSAGNKKLVTPPPIENTPYFSRRGRYNKFFLTYINIISLSRNRPVSRIFFDLLAGVVSKNPNPLTHCECMVPKKMHGEVDARVLDK